MTAMATPRHQVSVAVARAHADLDPVADAAVWSLDPAETRATLLEVTRLESRVAELKLRVAAHADELKVGEDEGATSTATWWAHVTRQVRPAATGQVKLAHALTTRVHVRDALAAGDLRVEQARVIVHALAQLPADLDPELVERAERHLVHEAGHYDAKQLGVLGKGLLEVVAPEVADAHEAELLAREEADALAGCRLTLVEDGHGRTHGRFTIPTLHGAMLRKALLAYAAPKHQTATHGPGAGVERRPGPQRLGRALCELIERLPADRLPQAGGVNATVLVTIDEATLLGDLDKAGVLDTGEHISADLARRLACEAGIRPAVLGGRSEILDLGRTRRYFTTAQRHAMALRDGGCTTDGCDWPPGLCHGHHDIPFARGGPTDLKHGRLLCPKHHARAHDPTFETRHLPGWKVAFHRRT